MSVPTLSKFAVQTLRKLAAGRTGRARADGGMILGAQTVPASVVCQLMAADLLRRDGDGLVATEAAEAWLRRQAKAPLPAAGEPVGAFRAQHMQVRPGAAPAVRGLVNQAESPLGWLARRKGRDGRPLITPEQLEAGERLRAHFELAGLSPKTTRAYDAPPVARGRRGPARQSDLSDRQLDARRRLDAAVAAVGPGLSDVLLRTCCFLEGLEEAERALGWPARSGKVVLSLALDRLAAHYDGKKRAPEGAQWAGETPERPRV